MEDCELMVIDRRDFIPLLKDRPDIALRIIEVLCARIRYISEQIEDSAERELPKLAEREDFSGLDVEELIVHGEAAAEIVRVAKEREIDLVVLSSHGRTGLGRILFGSTAEAVVRHAFCPVLVVKPQQGEDTNC